jgi:hypothetical protein
MLSDDTLSEAITRFQEFLVTGIFPEGTTRLEVEELYEDHWSELERRIQNGEGLKCGGTPGK